MAEELLSETSFQEIGTSGVDHWRFYEFSYLNDKGKPVINQLDLYQPAFSKGIIPSKLKTALNSFMNERFINEAEVVSALYKRLSVDVDDMEISLSSAQRKESIDIDTTTHLCIDDLIKNSSGGDYLISHPRKILGYSQSIMLNNFMFNCASTKQPFWARIFLKTKKCVWDVNSLAKYFSTFRERYVAQNDIANVIYNELCENIDKQVSVKLQFQLARRGGIDSNFLRSNTPDYAWLDNSRCIVQ